MSNEPQGEPFDLWTASPAASLLPSASWRLTLPLALAVAVVGCGGDDAPSVRPSEDSGDPLQGIDTVEVGRAPRADSTAVGHLVRNHLGDGRVETYVGFNLECGMCPGFSENPDWGSDFSNGFLDEGESCSYAPFRLVDGDPQTGWAEGREGVGIGAEVAVPALEGRAHHYALDDREGQHWVEIDPLDLTKPVRIWAGYGKSQTLFAANGRPKRLRVAVLRLRADNPDPHDMSGCSYSQYVEPVQVAEHELTLLDFNGYQALPIPEFQIEYYMEYPEEWLMMDGAERGLHEQRVSSGQATPFEREPTEFAYLLKLTLLEAYPGNRYEDTVISEISNGPPTPRLRP